MGGKVRGDADSHIPSTHQAQVSWLRQSSRGRASGDLMWSQAWPDPALKPTPHLTGLKGLQQPLMSSAGDMEI